MSSGSNEVLTRVITKSSKELMMMAVEHNTLDAILAYTATISILHLGLHWGTSRNVS